MTRVDETRRRLDLLLDDLPKDVEEEDVAAEVRPVGVAEDAGDELPPARVHVVQVQRLDEPHVQPLVGDEERDVDEQEEEYAVTLVGLGARPRASTRGLHAALGADELASGQRRIAVLLHQLLGVAERAPARAFPPRDGEVAPATLTRQ